MAVAATPAAVMMVVVVVTMVVACLMPAATASRLSATAAAAFLFRFHRRRIALVQTFLLVYTVIRKYIHISIMAWRRPLSKCIVRRPGQGLSSAG